MKRRISDMLDGYPENTVNLEQSTPLSSERIKELTMSKINQKEKKSRRIGVKLLALAAAISMLGVTAFAAEEIWGAGDFFRNILGVQLQESKDHAAENELDVTYPEPPAPDSPFFALPNCFLTPHMAGSAGDEVRRMGRYMEEEYTRFLAGGPCRYEVTLEMLETMA